MLFNQSSIGFIAVITLLAVILSLVYYYKKPSQGSNKLKSIYRAVMSAMSESDIQNQMFLSIDSEGDISNKKIEFPKFPIYPGMIIAYSPPNKSVTKAPDGWVFCDGNNGTPDLKGRFILGSGNSAKYPFNSYGGEDTHILTVDEMPSHQHLGSKLKGREWSTNMTNPPISTWLSDEPSGDNVGGSYTDSAGKSQPHNNMPPYYVLMYIMKL